MVYVSGDHSTKWEGGRHSEIVVLEENVLPYDELSIAENGQ